MRILAIISLVVLSLVATSAAAPSTALSATQASPCANTLTWQQASKKAGRTVSVTGLVTSAKFVHWKNGNGSMTFLDMGAKYPSPARFSVVVWNRNVAQYANKRVCARGQVTIYKGIPEMSVDNVSSLTLAR